MKREYRYSKQQLQAWGYRYKAKDEVVKGEPYYAQILKNGFLTYTIKEINRFNGKVTGRTISKILFHWWYR